MDLSAGHSWNVVSPRIRTKLLASRDSFRMSVMPDRVYSFACFVFGSVGGMKMNVPSGGFSTLLNASPASLAYHAMTSDHGSPLLRNEIIRSFAAGLSSFGSLVPGLGTSGVLGRSTVFGGSGTLAGSWARRPPASPVARAAPANERTQRRGQNDLRGASNMQSLPGRVAWGPP